MHEPSLNHDEAGRDGRPRRVLIIEDDRDSAELLAMCLAAEGIEALTAHDGVSGLDVARRHRPEVVVCDIGLPGLDGYGVAEAIRKEPGLEGCLLVALTGYDDEDALAEEAGFDRRITKPADVEALLALVAGPLSRPAT